MINRLLLCFLVLFLLADIQVNAADIFVAVTGSDSNNGSPDRPYATLGAALRKAREMRRLNDPAIAGGIHIFLKGGTYFLDEAVVIRPEDAGTASSPTIIEAATGEAPILSGGVRVSGWKKVTTPIAGLPAASLGKTWVADVPLQNFRQLWINNTKAIRAKSTQGDLMERIISWDKQSQTCWIPTPKFAVSKSANVEMFIHQWWAIAVLRIKKMEIHGDSTQLFFKQPESKIQSEHPWPAPWISKETGNSAFYLTNAIQFLDEPGEWFLDADKHKLYYYPRPGENMNTVSAIIPSLETLLKVEGSADRPVAHIIFKGINFQHAGWLRPSAQGHVPHQAGMYMTEAYKLRPAGTAEKKSLENQAWIGRPAAAVELNFADSTGFEGCRFEHLASTGLDYHTGVHHNSVTGNLFKDIGGTALLAGVFADEATEIHLPYNPGDGREVCDAMHITNNLVTDVTNEDWSCVGIGLGYTKNSLVAHNEIENVSYTGISMGWGWSPAKNAMENNVINANSVHHFGKHNYDCAGIYTLSAQPNSFITNNYVDSIYKAPYAHLPSHWFYLYTDEGSSFFTVKDNWTPTQKYLQNANGPGNNWINNGPAVSEAVRNNAGLETPFRYLQREKTSPSQHLPINKQRKEVFEIVVDQKSNFNIQQLKSILLENKIDTTAIYNWQNHYVIFDYAKDAGTLQGKLKNSFPGAVVKLYPDMFYEFNRQYCDDKKTAQEWDNVIITANLVADKKKQQEYLDYHATQFEKWPELARGFCNADFQQLLIYKNDRQLVLVISIPKGESLDKLNPKTMENNPRVNDWNKIMSQYQEGIEGTKKGESWVELKKL